MKEQSERFTKPGEAAWEVRAAAAGGLLLGHRLQGGRAGPELGATGGRTLPEHTGGWRGGLRGAYLAPAHLRQHRPPPTPPRLREAQGAGS